MWKCLARNKQCILLLLAFFLSSCAACPKWKVSSIKASYPFVIYSKFSWKPVCPFNGLEIEFVQNEVERHLYLNVCTLSLPINSECLLVDIRIDDTTTTFCTTPFAGDQRLELPIEAYDLVVCALLKYSPVTISVGRYQETLIADNFPQIFFKT